MSEGRFYVSIGVLVGMSMLVASADVKAQRSDSRDGTSGAVTVLFEQSNLPGTTSGQAQEYYFKKILENEIALLNARLQEKDKEIVALLQRKQDEYQRLMDQQRVLYERQLDEMKQTLSREKIAIQQEVARLQLDVTQEKARRQALEEAAKASFPRRDTAASANDRLEQVMVERHREQVSWAQQRKQYEQELNTLRAEAQRRSAGDFDQRLKSQAEEIQSLRQQNKELAARAGGAETQPLHQRIAALEQKLAASEQARAADQKSHATLLRDQQARYEERLAQAAVPGTAPDSQFMAKEYEDKLAAKYQQFDQVVREKEQAHTAALEQLRQELEATRTKSDEREKSLRQLLTEKDLAARQQKDQELVRLTQERDELRQASEQMRIYLAKLKSELDMTTAMVRQKDEHISELNRKLIFFEGTVGRPPAEQDGAGSGREENARLQARVDELTQEQEQIRRRYESTIDQQKQSALKAQKDYEAALTNNDLAWEKKIQVVEARYRERAKEMEQERERNAAETEQRLREVADRLRARAREDEEARQKMATFRASQMRLLEDMLESKVALVSSLDAEFRSSAAKNYFEQALASLRQKNYLTARQQLQNALSAEQNHQAVRNILESVEFLLERKN